jgi:long-chain acyl-CoA synthetase
MITQSDRPWFHFWPEGVPRHIDYPEVPLFQLLSSSTRKYPDNVAVSYQVNHLTYRELERLTNKFAHGLSDLGVKKGDRVLLQLPNSPEFVIAYYGILKVGATVVPINPLNKGNELKHYLNDSEATVIITNKNCHPIVTEIKSETGLKTVILTDIESIEWTVSLKEILAKYPVNSLEPALKPKEDVAVIGYTGGTTGLSKGVMLTHFNLVANAIQNAIWCDWNTQDIVIGLLPFYHSWGSCTCINSPIYAGARVIPMIHFNAEDLLKTIEMERATVLYGATSLFIMLANNPMTSKYNLSSLRYVKAGAMPIPPEAKERWEQVTGVKMILGYGLSEASPETHNCPPQRVRLGTIGIPIMDTDARIVDAEKGKTELPPGQVGELIIKGPQVMKGYLNRSEENKEALREGWLYTGDLAFVDDEGYFHIADRKKETIKYKGYTIAPAEVEAVLYEHPAVKECAVVGIPDAIVGEVPKAYVVLKNGTTLLKEELITFCAQRVAPYKKIREVEFIEEIPKTPVGKVLRRLLKDKT